MRQNSGEFVGLDSMKIVQIIPQLASGGAERFVVDLSNELSLKHDVTLLVASALDDKLAFYLPEVSPRVNIRFLSKPLGFNWRYMFRLYKTIKRESPDVVHTHMAAFKHFVVLRCFFPRVKFVNTIHCEASAESGNIIVVWLRRIFYKTGLCKAVTISNQSDLSFKAFHGQNMPSRVIFNGRSMTDIGVKDESLIPRVNGRYNLVSIGHISEVKNHMLLCSAFSQLTEQGAPLELYMFGRFANEDIVNQIKALNNPHIHMLGEVLNPQRYLYNADVFCMSSRSEAMPISLLEALSHGLIPICTSVGGIVDLVADGETGFLSPDLTTESYVNAIERFLALSESDITKMKSRCRTLSQQYSIEECASQYEMLYIE